MTPRTPQFEVFWPFNSSSESSGVSEDSKFPLLGVWASPSHLAQSGVATHMLDDPKHEIEGLHLPKGGCVEDQTFANNTALYLKGSPSNLSKAWVVLKLFCLAFGAKVNWGKSAAIWASKEKKEWEWGQEVGLRWIPEGQRVRYLGIQIGFRLPVEAIFKNSCSF